MKQTQQQKIDEAARKIIALLDLAQVVTDRANAKRDAKNTAAMHKAMGSPAPTVRKPASLSDILGHPIK